MVWNQMEENMRQQKSDNLEQTKPEERRRRQSSKPNSSSFYNFFFRFITLSNERSWILAQNYHIS